MWRTCNIVCYSRALYLLQGMAFAKKAFGDQQDAKPDYDAIASAVFSSPPIATVGLTEEEAIEQHKNVDIYTSSFKYGPPCSCAFPLFTRGCLPCMHTSSGLRCQ